jgi:hypothetical protein
MGEPVSRLSAESKARNNPSRFQFWLPRRSCEQRKGLCLVDQMRRIAQPHRATGAQVAGLLAKRVRNQCATRRALKLSLLDDTPVEAINVKLSSPELAAVDSNTQLPDVYPNWLTERIAIDERVLNALRKHGNNQNRRS